MEGLQVTLKNGVKIIKFNKPQRKNAINRQIYIKLTETLNQDSLDESVIVTIITGEGEYFTSGNDIKDAMQLSTGADPEAARVEANQVFKNLIQAFINYPKLLIAVVNGPAIGIGATMVGLCDVVYASDRATFHTPFVSLGLCCEGCSSYVFPMNMGRSKASEMLLLGRKITSQEAYASNLIARVIPHEKLEQLFDDLQLYENIT
ncbi:Enoyl-CoA hydratase/isomerase [Popillia japonica]|uniref:Enoyl-CoA hydratase/isomerase n=1 Tax=Popillia japonica TaxID=7064 RepID=A0AAW1M1N8_POPJA